MPVQQHALRMHPYLRAAAVSLVWGLAVVLLLVIAPVQAQPDDWIMIEPGGETTCADGSDYRFFVRDGGETDNLLIYFQEGGACWDWLTCNPLSPAYYKDASPNELQSFRFIYSFGGIFNFDEPENPVADYDMVFIPYCTGDVHAGSTTVTYQFLGGLDRTIHHQGYANVTAVLDWVFANYDDPASIVVTGSSAGAIGSIFHAPRIMAHYPDATITQLADGYVGVVPVGWEPLETWRVYDNLPDFMPDVDPQTFTINMLYLSIAQQFPQHRFAQFTTSGDVFQIGYFNIQGRDIREWRGLMYGYLDELEAALPNFRIYIVDAIWHTILPFDRFYTTTSDGVRFRDWFADLITGQPVDNVRCATCRPPSD